MEILECCGCETLSFRQTEWLSEWDEFIVNEDTGEEELRRGTLTYVYPPALARRLPSWIDELKDDVLKKVVAEVYSNLHEDNLITAAIGARILIDRVMTLLVGDVGGFDEKLKEMVKQNVISATEKTLLEAVTDAGNAAAHRGYSPKSQHLHTIMDTIENLLHRMFVLSNAAAVVRTAVPPRPRRVKSKP
ncbi:MAG: DUF4145 domain-containing protein [Acidobacteriaceae bacterium]|nr:DUF4145 domain-containing protein [Acidobacteriaceae bacterium]